MKDLVILGAFDRFNYGDLLFPIIIEEYIKKYRPNIFDKYNVDFYALVESDLSSLGGKPTKSLLDIIDTDKLGDGSFIIVSGGEVLPCRITSSYYDLLPNRKLLIINKIIRKLLGTELYERFIKNKFRYNNNFPWVVSKEFFKNRVDVVFNTVGGSILDEYSEKDLSKIKRQMSGSKYISVRDERTLNTLKKLGLAAKLIPDSATAMSVFFPKEHLASMAGSQVKDIIAANKNNYICLQVNYHSFSHNQQELAAQLKKIYEKYKCGIVLLPIGTATNHDDDMALSKLKSTLDFPCILPGRLNVYEIMLLIAESNCFIGTSLHGNITAMSFAVPHIGLSKMIPKLDEYLKTWDVPQIGGNIEFNQLFDKFNDVISIDKSVLEAKRDEVIHLVMQNFDNIFNIIK